MGAQWISEDQCADGKIFWCQTDNHVRIVAVLENAVGSMSWLRALGCTMMMVNERLVPSRLKSLIGDNPCEEEVSGGAPNSENVDVCK